MKKYYNLVISVLDLFGNRIDAHPITGDNNLNYISSKRDVLKSEIQEGKYDKFKRENCTLSPDIEVHNDETWELLYII